MHHICVEEVGHEKLQEIAMGGKGTESLEDFPDGSMPHSCSPEATGFRDTEKYREGEEQKEHRRREEGIYPDRTCSLERFHAEKIDHPFERGRKPAVRAGIDKREDKVSFIDRQP